MYSKHLVCVKDVQNFEKLVLIYIHIFFNQKNEKTILYECTSNRQKAQIGQLCDDNKHYHFYAKA